MTRHIVLGNSQSEPSIHAPDGTILTISQACEKLNESMEPLRVIDIAKSGAIPGSATSMFEATMKIGFMKIRAEVTLPSDASKTQICHALAEDVAKRVRDDAFNQIEEALRT